MKLTKSQINWLNKVVVGTWKLNDHGLIDVDGHVGTAWGTLKAIPVQFGVVSENFNCSYNRLISLFGSPEKVGGRVCCYNNQLTSLSDSPKEVGGRFDCSYNKLSNLFGAPEKMGGSFYPGEGKFDCSPEFALLWITKSKLAIVKINNPSEEAIRYHNMLWEI